MMEEPEGFERTVGWTPAKLISWMLAHEDVPYKDWSKEDKETLLEITAKAVVGGMPKELDYVVILASGEANEMMIASNLNRMHRYEVLDHATRQTSVQIVDEIRSHIQEMKQDKGNQTWEEYKTRLAELEKEAEEWELKKPESE